MIRYFIKTLLLFFRADNPSVVKVDGKVDGVNSFILTKSVQYDRFVA